jgi:hypothetical protein
MIHISYSSLNIKKVTESRRRQVRHAACTMKRNEGRIYGKRQEEIHERLRHRQ